MGGLPIRVLKHVGLDVSRTEIPPMPVKSEPETTKCIDIHGLAFPYKIGKTRYLSRHLTREEVFILLKLARIFTSRRVAISPHRESKSRELIPANA
jgi:hypothetical protein